MEYYIATSSHCTIDIFSKCVFVCFSNSLARKLDEICPENLSKVCMDSSVCDRIHDLNWWPFSWQYKTAECNWIYFNKELTRHLELYFGNPLIATCDILLQGLVICCIRLYIIVYC